MISRPHPGHYGGEDGWQATFFADLQVWITTVAATWLTMTPTGHETGCRCCINFRTICCNHEDQFRSLLGDKYTTARVSLVEIQQWAQMLDITGSKTAFESITNAARAWISNEADSSIVAIKSDHSRTTSKETKDDDMSEADDIKPYTKEILVISPIDSGTNAESHRPKRRRCTQTKAKGTRDVRERDSSESSVSSSSTEHTSEHESRQHTSRRDSLGHETKNEMFKVNAGTVIDVTTGKQDEVAIGDISNGKAIVVNVRDLRNSMGLPLLTRYLRNIILCLQSTTRVYDTYCRQNRKRQTGTIRNEEAKWNQHRSRYGSKRFRKSRWKLKDVTSLDAKSEPPD